MDTAEHTLERLKRMHGQFADFQRQLDSVQARLSSLEQYHATMTGDIVQIRVELTDIRVDAGRIKCGLDLVEVGAASGRRRIRFPLKGLQRSAVDPFGTRSYRPRRPGPVVVLFEGQTPCRDGRKSLNIADATQGPGGRLAALFFAHFAPQ